MQGQALQSATVSDHRRGLLWLQKCGEELEGEQVLLKWQTANGGDLTRIDIAHAAPIGAFQGWCPLRPVTQLVAVR